MNLSRRRFVQGAAATLLAAPLLRNPEPEVETPFHRETVPDPRTRWDLPPEHANCRCDPIEYIRACPKDVWESGATFVPADPPIPHIVSNSNREPILGVVTIQWDHEPVSGMELVQIRGFDANGDEQTETFAS
jgi:hypothetical protein